MQTATTTELMTNGQEPRGRIGNPRGVTHGGLLTRNREANKFQGYQPTVNSEAETHPRTRKEVREWIRAETRARRLEEDDNPNVTLAPTDRFATRAHFRNENEDRAGGKVKNAGMVRGRIAGKCCGWPEAPTVDEALRAMLTRRPTKREIDIAETVICKATIVELAEGEQQESYCLQDLAWWMHFTQIMPPRKVRWLNRCIGVGPTG